MRTHTTSLLTLAIAAAIALTGCATSAPQAELQTAGDVVTIDNAWVKAADSGMTAAFGDLVNSGTQDVTVVSVTSPASTDLQLHETVKNDAGEMMMQQKDGGFVIPASGSLLLEPGASHIMMMNLVNPIKAGDSVTFTLTFSDGSTMEFTAPAKDYSGANENYKGDMNSDMNMNPETDMNN